MTVQIAQITVIVLTQLLIIPVHNAYVLLASKERVAKSMPLQPLVIIILVEVMTVNTLNVTISLTVSISVLVKLDGQEITAINRLIRVIPILVRILEPVLIVMTVLHVTASQNIPDKYVKVSF